MVWHVEEGLAAVTVQEDVGAESALAGGGGCAGDARGGQELVCGGGDFEADWEVAGDGLGMVDVGGRQGRT